MQGCMFLYVFVHFCQLIFRSVFQAREKCRPWSSWRRWASLAWRCAKFWYIRRIHGGWSRFKEDDVFQFSHLQGLQVQPRKLRVWSGDVSKRLHLNFCHNILSHLVEWIVQNEYSNRTNALRGMRFDWRCRLAWRLDGNGVYMQTYSTLLVPFLALTSKPLEIALDGLVQQVSRAKFRRTTRYLHVSSICRISMEFCLFPSSHCGRQKPNEAHRSTTRSNFYSTSTTFVVPNGSKWIHMKDS